jgi:hypothetical protein
MKTIKNYLAALSLLTIGVALFSFSPKGGEGFEIYLNNKLVIQQFGNNMANVRSLQLDQTFSNEELTVKYYHCGQAGKDRHVLVKNNQGNILKDWQFYDNSKNGAMDCPVNEILALQKENSSVNLYYVSKEIPNGRFLVTLTSGRSSQVKP